MSFLLPPIIIAIDDTCREQNIADHFLPTAVPVAPTEDAAKPAPEAPAPVAVAGTEDPAAKAYPTPDQAAAASGNVVLTRIAPDAPDVAEEPKKEEAKPAAI